MKERVSVPLTSYQKLICNNNRPRNKTQTLKLLKESPREYLYAQGGKIFFWKKHRSNYIKEKN